MNYRWPFKIGKILLMIVVGIVGLSFVVMLLWNALIPDLFKGPSVSFWQAAGLLVLSHLLLRGWGRWRYTNGWRQDRWKHRLEDKLAAMAPEDRENFKREWRSRCGWKPDETEQNESKAP